MVPLILQPGLKNSLGLSSNTDMKGVPLPVFTRQIFFFFDEPETKLKKGETELQRPPGLFQNDGRETSTAISKIKRTKKLQERDHFAKVWAAVLHCLETHFTKTLSDTDKNNLNSEHKDQNLQGGVIVSSDGDICIISFVNVLDASGTATVSHLFTPRYKSTVGILPLAS